MRLPVSVELLLIGLAAAIVLSRAAMANGIAGAPEPPKTVQDNSPKRDLYGDPLPPGAVMRLGTVKYRQDSPVYRIAYTPDGKHFITDGEDNIIRVWDTAEGRIIRRIDPGVGALEDYAIATRGRRVMAVGKTVEPGRGFVQNVAMIDLDTGRTDDQASWVDEDPGYHPLALCADRHCIAIGMDPQGVRVLDAWNGAEIVRFETGHREPAHIVFSQDGKRLAVETHGEDPQERRLELRLYDLDRKCEIRVIARDEHRFSDLIFSPDGRMIAAPSGLELDVWNVDTGERISFENAFGDHVGFSPDGRILAGIAGFGRIGVFDLAARRVSTSFRTGLTDLGEVALSPDGRTLVANNGQIILHAWDLEQRRDRFATTGTHTAPINEILASPDGRTLATGSLDHTVRLWELGTARSSRELRLSGSAGAMALSPDGRWLAAATFMHHQVFAWDLSKESGPIVLAYSGGRFDVIAPLAARFLDDRTLLLVDQAAKVHRMDLIERRMKSTTTLNLSPPDPAMPPTGDDRLSYAVFLPGGKKLATLGIFTGLHIYETETGKELLHTKGGDLLVPSPDGQLLALTKSTGEPRLSRTSGLVGRKVGIVPLSTSGVIRLLDAGSGQELRQMAVEGSKPWALAFSPDGKTLAATSGWETGRIHFFDVGNGRPIGTIDAPPLRSPALAYTPDGTRLVSGMADGSVLIWDVRPDR